MDHQNPLILNCTKWFCCLALSALVTLSHSAHAFSNERYLASAGEVRKKLIADLKSKPKVKLEAKVSAESVTYPTQLDKKSTLNESFNTSAGAQLHMSSGYFVNGFEFFGIRDWSAKNSQFGLNELYTSYQDQSTQVHLGRAKKDWNEADRLWALGLWEPTFAVDSLRIQNQGNTGLFFEKRLNPSFEVLAFATPLFIPTMTPEVQEDKGSLASESRWFKSPSSSSPILNKETQVKYAVSVPELEQLVRNWGAGLSLKYNATPEWAARVSAAYKPVNRLALKYKRELVLLDGAQNASATVSPHVLYHQLLGADLGYFSNERSVFLSSNFDRPSEPVGEQNWIKQRLSPLVSHALTYQENELAVGSFRPDFLVSYINVQTNDVVDVDSSGAIVGSLFKERTLFTNALKTEIRLQAFLLGKKFSQRFSYLREFDQQGSIYGYEAEAFLLKDISVFAGFDVLGVDDPESQRADTRFLNQFRSNDRAFGGLNYVF